MTKSEKDSIKTSGGTITALKEYIKSKIDYSEYKTLKIKYVEQLPLQSFDFKEFIDSAQNKKKEKKENKRLQKAKKQAEYRQRKKKEADSSPIEKWKKPQQGPSLEVDENYYNLLKKTWLVTAFKKDIYPKSLKVSKDLDVPPPYSKDFNEKQTASTEIIYFLENNGYGEEEIKDLFDGKKKKQQPKKTEEELRAMRKTNIYYINPQKVEELKKSWVYTEYRKKIKEAGFNRIVIKDKQNIKDIPIPIKAWQKIPIPKNPPESFVTESGIKIIWRGE